jgi:S1-C subfamily serine protease
MKSIYLLPLLLLGACQKSTTSAPPPSAAAPAPAAAAPETPATAPAADANLSVVRINATLQNWNVAQPWEKNPPRRRRSLGALVGDRQVITTAEMVADATFVELESTDGTRRMRAEVANVDYEANLALLELPEGEEAAAFFQGRKVLEIAPTPPLRDTLEIIQVEDNGQSLITAGQLLSADVRATFLPGQLFLTYRVKASMQSSASSFTVPVFNEGKLAGILSSYDSKDQISDVIATPLIARFLMESKKETYQGFPNLGVNINPTEDIHFRSYLKIPESEGGIYVSKVRKGSAADTAKLQPGDVILAIDGNPIDRRGYYKDPIYGALPWVQLVRGNKSAGDSVTLSLWRDGKALEVPVTLTRQEESTRLVPNYQFGVAPNFLIKGGMIFQELTRPLLEAYGEDWESRAPLNFLDAMSNPEAYQERHDRMICLTGVIPTQATVGYESMRNLMVSRINGKPVRNMKDMIAAFKALPLSSKAHSIEFLDETIVIYLDEKMSDLIDQNLLQRGLHQLSRAE